MSPRPLLTESYSHVRFRIKKRVRNREENKNEMVGCSGNENDHRVVRRMPVFALAPNARWTSLHYKVVGGADVLPCGTRDPTGCMTLLGA